ncbi:MAG: anthranilate synthase component I family protein [Alphaproteobacteria bacterium]|nr:anthranilate synthase component I family protein [Alphaproteobacteria bacterium]
MTLWQRQETGAWVEPLALARRYAGGDMALLYSGVMEATGGHDSYLFLDPVESLSGDDWAQLPALPAQADGLPLWVGYLGYGLRDDPPRGAPGPITLPGFRLTRYARLLRFNHQARAIEHFAATGKAATINRTPIATTADAMADTPPPPARMASNFTRTQYESVVAQTVERIHAGDFYQANITRKFFGQFEKTPDDFSLFERLCAASPAPYSAYIRNGEQAILSSSPECFLRINATGKMTTRPIKGSARRSDAPAEDARLRDALAQSAKDHAENLMIVDLMRNDFARVSVPETVRVLEQSALYSYRTIHHLISTVEGQKLPHVGAYEAVRACFPPGSMTGAPKIAAMRWCTEQEPMERGVYSGAIGWFGAGETCDLSVVIRTLILDGDRFEFQVGGGIVADSTPEAEWRETLAKARGILLALGLNENALEEL